MGALAPRIGRVDRLEQREFSEAMAEAESLIARAEAAMQRARSRCHGEHYEHVEVISKRIYELRVRTEWLRLVVLGEIEPASVPFGVRLTVDRRSAIDRRVQSMRQQLLSRPS